MRILPLCSVHTTVTLKVASQLVCVSAASAAAVSLGETPACHENQDYLNLFSWRSFTQTFPALSRKLVFFTTLGGWVTRGGRDGGGSCARMHLHARASHTHNNCLYTRMRTCTKAWSFSPAPGQQGAPRGSELPSASLCAFNLTVTVTERAAWPRVPSF